MSEHAAWELLALPMLAVFALCVVVATATNCIQRRSGEDSWHHWLLAGVVVAFGSVELARWAW